MDRLEQKEIMKKGPPSKNTWHDWLIKNITKAMKKQREVLKTKF